MLTFAYATLKMRVFAQPHGNQSYFFFPAKLQQLCWEQERHLQSYRQAEAVIVTWHMTVNSTGRHVESRDCSQLSPEQKIFVEHSSVRPVLFLSRPRSRPCVVFLACVHLEYCSAIDVKNVQTKKRDKNLKKTFVNVIKKRYLFLV